MKLREKGEEGTSPCPVCASRDVHPFVHIVDVPVHCNVLRPTRGEALSAPRSQISLGFCGSCGHVYNMSFEPELVRYDQGYDASLHFSPHFREYAESLCRRLIGRYGLLDKTVLEIGCGKGDFLGMLCRSGCGRGIGFDPSYEHERNPEEGDTLTFIRDFYSRRYADCEAALVCCRHTLEHVPHPRAFLTDLRDTLSGNADTVVFFEVPNVAYTLVRLGIWDIIYEHCSYFSGSSLCALFESCGFRILDLYEAYEGQFLCVEAKLAAGAGSPSGEYQGQWDDLRQAVLNFGEAYQERVRYWAERFEDCRRGDRRVVVWGAGSKGVTFLNAVGCGDLIDCVVDINPHKEGKFIPGTGHVVVHPRVLTERAPDVVLVMNPVYLNEICGMIRDLGLDADVMTV